MVYLDTSVAVALLVPEPGSALALSWFARAEHLPLLSDWLIAEFASALSIKERSGQLSAPDARAARRNFDAFCKGVRVAPVSRGAFQRAALLAAQPGLGLRAGDALHLAIAQEVAARAIATLDRRMGQAAEQLGLSLEFPPPGP